MTDFTPAERTALDRATVPSMGADFAARVLAARSEPLPPPTPHRRLRNALRRHRGAAIGIGALLLTSAAAATTGVLDRLPQAIPALAQAIGVTKPEPKPTPKPVRVAAPQPAPTVTPTPANPVLERRERIRARVSEMTPQQRVALARRVRDRLRAMPPAQRQAALGRLREEYRALTPEQRAELRRDFQVQREQRVERRREAVDRAIESGTIDPVAAERIERLREWRRQRREGFSEPVR